MVISNEGRVWLYMSKVSIILFVSFLLISGCTSSNNGKAENTWDYKEGFVGIKEKGEVLVVRDKVSGAKEISLENILKQAKPNAIWLAVNDEDYNKVNVGDKIKITIIGVINQSYPARAKADSLAIIGQ